MGAGNRRQFTLRSQHVPAPARSVRPRRRPAVGEVPLLRPPLPALPPPKLRLASKPYPQTIDHGDALWQRVLDRMEDLNRSKRRRRLGRFAITFLLLRGGCRGNRRDLLAPLRRDSLHLAVAVLSRPSISRWFAAEHTSLKCQRRSGGVEGQLFDYFAGDSGLCRSALAEPVAHGFLESILKESPAQSPGRCAG